MALECRGKRCSRVATALPFHVLRYALLQPDGAAAAGFLSDEAMRQLVLENTRKFVGHRREAFARHADAAIVEGARPAWSARDVHECLIRVENHADGFRRDIVEGRGNLLELGFQS